jgi:hypothetical protein
LRISAVTMMPAASVDLMFFFADQQEEILDQPPAGLAS